MYGYALQLHECKGGAAEGFEARADMSLRDTMAAVLHAAIGSAPWVQQALATVLASQSAKNAADMRLMRPSAEQLLTVLAASVTEACSAQCGVVSLGLCEPTCCCTRHGPACRVVCLAACWPWRQLCRAGVSLRSKGCPKSMLVWYPYCHQCHFG